MHHKSVRIKHTLRLCIFKNFRCRLLASPAFKKNNGREERIRTSDPSVPNAVLYQTEPLPDTIDALYYSLSAAVACGFHGKEAEMLSAAPA